MHQLQPPVVNRVGRHASVDWADERIEGCSAIAVIIPPFDQRKLSSAPVLSVITNNRALLMLLVCCCAAADADRRLRRGVLAPKLRQQRPVPVPPAPHHKAKGGASIPGPSATGLHAMLTDDCIGTMVCGTTTTAAISTERPCFQRPSHS